MTRTKFTDSRHWEFPEFTQQDVNLLVAYNRVKKFRVTKPEQLKAGIFVEVRDTTAFDNCLVEVVKLNGYAMMSSGSYPLMRFHNTITFREKRSTYNDNASSLWRIPEQGSWKQRQKRALGGIYVSSLVGYWMTFHYNAKVKEFIELLKKADRFQQHCIIKGVEYTEDNYATWKMRIEMDRDYDDYIENHVLKS